MSNRRNTQALVDQAILLVHLNLDADFSRVRLVEGVVHCPRRCHRQGLLRFVTVRASRDSLSSDCGQHHVVERRRGFEVEALSR